LEKKARIGLFSPAGPHKPREAAEALEKLRGLGARFHPLPARGKGPLKYLAGPDRLRLEDVEANAGLSGPGALMATRGGYGSMRLLEALDRGPRKFSEAAIVGSSDVTALHLFRLAKENIGGWHSPNLVHYAKTGADLNSFRGLFGGKKREWVFSGSDVLAFEKVEGRLLGGNLTVFSHLCGTRFCPDARDSILLLEDVNERPYAIDRYLTSLILRGVFRRAAAVVFGEFVGCGKKDELDRVLGDFSERVGIPVLKNAPFGHGLLSEPWFYGEKGTLRKDGDAFKLSFSGGRTTR
jgi:muramoyltetrapeptide carboxypeptidase